MGKSILLAFVDSINKLTMENIRFPSTKMYDSVFVTRIIIIMFLFLFYPLTTKFVNRLSYFNHVI